MTAARMTPEVQRIELVVREGLGHAIRLYGTSRLPPGRSIRRGFRLSNGAYEADLPMACSFREKLRPAGTDVRPWLPRESSASNRGCFLRFLIESLLKDSASPQRT